MHKALVKDIDGIGLTIKRETYMVQACLNRIMH